MKGNQGKMETNKHPKMLAIVEREINKKRNGELKTEVCECQMEKLCKVFKTKTKKTKSFCLIDDG